MVDLLGLSVERGQAIPYVGDVGGVFGEVDVGIGELVAAGVETAGNLVEAPALLVRERPDLGQLGVEDVEALREELDCQDLRRPGVVARRFVEPFRLAVEPRELVDQLTMLTWVGIEIEVADLPRVRDEVPQAALDGDVQG